MLQLNMEKLEQRKNLVLNLKKERNLEGLAAQVVLALDISVSMKSLYNSGVVQETVERILPLALAFDDDGQVDVHPFQTQNYRTYQALNKDNCVGYVDTYIKNSFPFGGTYYAPVLKAIFDQYTYTGKTNWLGQAKRDEKMELPVYIIFITDGDNDSSDKAATKRVIKEMSAYGLFIHCVPIGKESFPFLEKLDDLDGRVLDNVCSTPIANLSQTTDEVLYDLLLKEYPDWYKLAKSKKMF